MTAESNMVVPQGHGSEARRYSLHYDRWRSASLWRKGWILLKAVRATRYKMSVL